MAEFVGTLALAAESYLWRQYTWFGAEKCNYTARALARRCKDNSMDSELQMEDQLGLLIMRTGLECIHSSAEVELNINKAELKRLRTKQIE